jgi:WD40 repeat protein
LATGRPTTTIEVGHGTRTLNTYLSISPDWKTAIGAARDRGVFDKVEVDGKRLNRVTHDSQIFEWDLSTGAVLRTLQHEPRRGVGHLAVSPDGKFALSRDELSGTFEQFRGQASTLWNLATGVPRDVGQGRVWVGVFAPDSRSFAIVVPKLIETVSTTAIKILAVPDCKEILTIPFDDERVRADVGRFTSDGHVLIGAMYKHASPSDFKNFESSLVFWDCETGRQLFSLPSHEKNEAHAYMTESPDGRTLAVISWGLSPRRGRLTLIDLAERSARSIEIADGALARVAVFHPSSKWLAVATQVLPERTTQREPLPEELPQPKIECVDLASGQIVETIVTPQCYLHAMEFSPDGTTLATSGKGAVLLWDFHSRPGTLAAAVK